MYLYIFVYIYICIFVYISYELNHQGYQISNVSHSSPLTRPYIFTSCNTDSKIRAYFRIIMKRGFRTFIENRLKCKYLAL